MIDLRKGFERRSVVLLIASLGNSSTNAVHPRAPVFHPRLPVRDRFTASEETVTRERHAAVASRADARGDLLRMRTPPSTTPAGYRSPGVKFVSANTRVRAGDALSGGREPA